MCPMPTLQVHPLRRACTHMTRGQDGSLLLFLYDSFIHYFTPVYPDAIQTRVSAPRASAIWYGKVISSQFLVDHLRFSPRAIYIVKAAAVKRKDAGRKANDVPRGSLIYARLHMCPTINLYVIAGSAHTYGGGRNYHCLLRGRRRHA